MKIARKLSLLMLLTVLVPMAAHADFVATTAPNCGSCYGGTYSLSFAGEHSGSTFIVTLTIITPSDPKSVVAGQYISGVGFGDGKEIASAKLLSTTAGGSWSNVLGNINSSGACDGSPGNKVCSQQNTNVPPFQMAKADGSTYQWVWEVTFKTPGLNTDPSDIHISAQYQDYGGSKGHIVSESGAGIRVPEPSTAAMLGVGLAMLTFRLRRRG